MSPSGSMEYDTVNCNSMQLCATSGETHRNNATMDELMMRGGREDPYVKSSELFYAYLARHRYKSSISMRKRLYSLSNKRSIDNVSSTALRQDENSLLQKEVSLPVISPQTNSSNQHQIEKTPILTMSTMVAESGRNRMNFIDLQYDTCPDVTKQPFPDNHINHVSSLSNLHIPPNSSISTLDSSQNAVVPIDKFCKNITRNLSRNLSNNSFRINNHNTTRRKFSSKRGSIEDFWNCGKGKFDNRKRNELKKCRKDSIWKTTCSKPVQSLHTTALKPLQRTSPSLSPTLLLLMLCCLGNMSSNCNALQHFATQPESVTVTLGSRVELPCKVGH